MLSELTIENIAIVKRESIRFSSPFSVITGETGAGKSIIIDCIGLIMGERASRELIRSGETKACVTAMFSNVPKHIIAAAAKYGIDCDGELILSRELTLDGSGALGSVARIGGKPVSAAVMREIAANLLNLHTQHQSQTLMNDENHMIFLDCFADIESDIAAYGEIYKAACDGERRISALKKSEQEKARICDMLRFQINEIKAVSPKENEKENLEALAVKIRNAEEISKHVRLITRTLYRSEKGLSACDLIDKAISAVEALGDVFPKSAEYVEQLNDMRAKLEDIAETVSGECAVDIENPSEQLDRIESRLDAIEKLGRKYGQTVGEILAFKKDAEDRLKEIESADEQIEDIKNELRTVYAKLKEAAAVVTKKRRDAAQILEKRITEELYALEMEKVKFKIEISPLQSYAPSGIDNVMFLVSTNPGEPLLPLSKIASGGELSRMMLALKCALADKERTPTLIFDEIDTGISGRTSHKIGLKFREISDDRTQVICVTHSPQIAALA
ncbi:MAG: DNA repair protein RecN, partial [Clostridiales bacterium]|nr:DNA repair protein RecN [Clostridiales bacterium]